MEAAVGLFYEKGFEGTALAELLARAEANSGSFYHFFKSKEDLLNAVLDWYRAHLQPILIEPLRARTPDPIERIFALLDGYRQRVLSTGCTYGCPIGRLALEIDPARLEIHAAIAKNFAGWTGAVEKFLEDAGDRLPPGLDRAELAQFVLTVMEGGVMQSRSHRSIEPFDAGVRQLRHYFRQLEAEAAASRRPKVRRKAGRKAKNKPGRRRPPARKS